jgi:hypothetical protein
MLEILALCHRRPRSLGRAGALERPAEPQEQTADDCWQITLCLRLPRLEEVPVRPARDSGEKDLAWEHLLMQDRAWHLPRTAVAGKMPAL